MSSKRLRSYADLKRRRSAECMSNQALMNLVRNGQAELLAVAPARGAVIEGTLLAVVRTDDIIAAAARRLVEFGPDCGPGSASVHSAYQTGRERSYRKAQEAFAGFFTEKVSALFPRAPQEHLMSVGKRLFSCKYDLSGKRSLRAPRDYRQRLRSAGDHLATSGSPMDKVFAGAFRALSDEIPERPKGRCPSNDPNRRMLALAVGVLGALPGPGRRGRNGKSVKRDRYLSEVMALRDQLFRRCPERWLKGVSRSGLDLAIRHMEAVEARNRRSGQSQFSGQNSRRLQPI